MNDPSGAVRRARCLRLANAFREQAKKVETDWPLVADSLRETAHAAERAAALIEFRSQDLTHGSIQ